MSLRGRKNSQPGGHGDQPATPEYLRWSKVPITFNCSDDPDFIPKPGRYPLVVYPIVKDVKLN
jgi:hypothetical protein